MTTADRILRGVKRRVSLPANQTLFQDPDLLEIADDMVKLYIIPEIVSVRQDFLVRQIRVPTVTGQEAYEIPARAVGQTLRDLKLVQTGTRIARDLRLLSSEDEHLFTNNGGVPHSMYFKGDAFILVPPPDGESWEIGIWFEMMVSSLCLEAAAAKVTNISGDDITVDMLPSTFAVDGTIDFIRGVEGHSVIDFDVPITNIAGLTLSFATGAVPAAISETITATLQVGDYISLAGTSPVLQLPDLCSPYLESLIAMRIMQSSADYDLLSTLQKDVDKELSNMQRLLAPRIRGETTKIINRNGLLRGRRNPIYRNRTVGS